MLFMITDYTTSLMVGRNKVRPIMKFGSLAYILEIIVLLFLVPTFKGYGMVVAASIVLPIMLLLFYHKSIADDLNIKFDPRRPIQVVIMALIATVLVAPVPFAILPTSLINDIIILVVTAVLLIIIYPPLLTLTGTMVEKDIGIIKKTSAGIPVAGKILCLLWTTQRDLLGTSAGTPLRHVKYELEVSEQELEPIPDLHLLGVPILT